MCQYYQRGRTDDAYCLRPGGHRGDQPRTGPEEVRQISETEEKDCRAVHPKRRLIYSFQNTSQTQTGYLWFFVMTVVLTSRYFDMQPPKSGRRATQPLIGGHPSLSRATHNRASFRISAQHQSASQYIVTFFQETISCQKYEIFSVVS